MTIGCATATNSGTANSFAVCPTWTNGACACTKDANGNPEPPHRTFAFGATPPQGWTMTTAPAEWTNLGHTQQQWTGLTVPQQWAFMCLVEAIRIVKHDLSAAQSTPVSSLVGITA